MEHSFKIIYRDSDWINSQKLTNPLYCLGDGHDGIWNIIAEIGEQQERIEILDWYHLTENIYKVEAKKRDLEQLKSYLWMGEVSSALAFLRKLKPVGGQNFCKYLKKHRPRIINYHYFQWQKSKFNWEWSSGIGSQTNSSQS